MDSSCAVCIETFTKQPNKKKAKCPYCDIKACVKCTQTYLLGSYEDPHCMGCRRGWSREVMDEILLKTWLNGDYKIHRENILLDRERSRLPAAQLILERHKIASERSKTILEPLGKEIRDLQEQINQKQNEYMHELRRIEAYKRGEDPTAVDDTSKESVKEEKRVFIMPCSVTGCRGFLSQAYKCGVCDTYACPDCREIKGMERDAPHTCDPNTVATVRAMKKECRGCPECGTNIFKIEGCFGKDTPIRMWDGTIKQSQTIQIGDILVGDDSKKRTVEHVFQGEDTLYEIQQKNGASYTVNGKHTLVLKYIADKIIYHTKFTNRWKVKWMDRLTYVIKTCKFETYEKAEAYCSNVLSFSEEIEITVENYMQLNKWQKMYLMGYKVSPYDPTKTYKTSIEVVEKGKGIYYGWIIGDNHRFLHEDYTVLRNCNQMFCTNCNTPFDWVSGKKIVNGAIHNPHYFEYLRASNNGVMPRNPGDIPCITNLPGAWQFDREVTRKFYGVGLCSEFTDFLYSGLNTITHIQHVEIRRNINNAEDMNNTTANLKYLSQEYSEARWKQVLQQKEKRRMKRDEIRMRCEAFVGACVDIYGRIMNEARQITSTVDWKKNGHHMNEICKDAVVQMHALSKIFNEGMIGLSKRYNCQVIQIGKDKFKLESKKYDSGRVLKRSKKDDTSTVSSNDSEELSIDTDTSADVPKGNVLVKITTST
jgi:hypothetical protein